MRKIDEKILPKEIIKLLREENPFSEDIGIFTNNGELSGVTVTPEAYRYFLSKVEEDEEKEDCEELESIDKDTVSQESIDIDHFITIL